MNQVVLVNENDEVIGTMFRDEAHEKRAPHRIAVIFVENNKGEILIQVRMSGKLDHSSAGHVDPGETYLQAAVRELKEELGIEGVNLVSIGKGKDNVPHFFEVFVCRSEPGVLQEEEVKSVYWAKPEDILKDMEKDPEKFTRGFVVSLGIYLKWKSEFDEEGHSLAVGAGQDFK